MATQEYTPSSSDVIPVIVSWLLRVMPSIFCDIDMFPEDWSPSLSIWSPLNHRIIGGGSALARQEATKASSLTTSRTAEGEKTIVGGTEKQSVEHQKALEYRRWPGLQAYDNTLQTYHDITHTMHILPKCNTNPIFKS